ncbi:MAG: hypothetical protein ACK4IX_00065 [Candidatus Sericytochromatia bacterium]
MMGIIVEGIDCSGKSTLVKNLKFRLKNYGGYDVKELEHLDKKNQFQRYLREYSNGYRTIFDRSHISELVFSKYLRNTEVFVESEIDILDSIIRTQYILVVATPSIENFNKRMLETKKLQVIDSKSYFDLISLFDYATKSIPHIKYTSTDEEELNAIIDVIISKLKGFT